LSGLMAVRGNGLSTSGLILDGKGSFLEAVVSLSRKLGRFDDLCILSSEHWESAARTPLAIGWNPADTTDSPVDFATRFSVCARLVGGVSTQDSFFFDAARIYMRHAFTLCRAFRAPEPTSLFDILRLTEPVEDGQFYNEIVRHLAEVYSEDVPAE